MAAQDKDGDARLKRRVRSASRSRIPAAQLHRLDHRPGWQHEKAHGKGIKLQDRNSWQRLRERGQKGEKVNADENDDLHVLITGKREEGLDRAAKEVQSLLVPVDDQKNSHKQKQLRELALINGTLRDNDFCRIWGEKGHVKNFKAAGVKCAICGDSSHLTCDCTQKKKSVAETAAIDEEYNSFMQQMGEKPVISTATKVPTVVPARTVTTASEGTVHNEDAAVDAQAVSWRSGYLVDASTTGHTPWPDNVGRNTHDCVSGASGTSRRLRVSSAAFSVESWAAEELLVKAAAGCSADGKDEMDVDSSGNMVVSPISVRGQERLARLRASIQHQFGGDGGGMNRTTSRSLNMDQTRSSVYGQSQQQQQPRSKIRQRIEQASKMTSDEIFFREFGSPKQLMALDFDLARTEQPRLSSRHVDLSARPIVIANSSARVMTTTAQYSNAPLQTSFSTSTSTRVEQSRLDHSAIASATNRSHSVRDWNQHSRSSAPVTAAANERRSGSSPTVVIPSASAFSTTSQSTVRAVERPAYVSQLQRPTRILTPKKQTLKRQRSADEPSSVEKTALPPPAQKPRLLSDVTSTFNNRSFSNVGQARGSSSNNTSTTSRSANVFMNSPVRKAPTFARPTMLQLPSPSKFRVPTSTTRLFGQRQGSYR